MKLFGNITVLASLALVACIQEGQTPDGPDSGPAIEVVQNLEVEPSGISNGIVPVKIFNAEGWTVKVESEPCVENASFDISASVIRYEIPENESGGERNGKISISLEKENKKNVSSEISVLQRAFPVIDAEENIYVGAEGITDGSISVKQTFADGWTVAVDKLGCVTSAKFDEATSSIIYSVGPNPYPEEIRGAITLSLQRANQRSTVAVISVLQAGNDSDSHYRKVTSTPNDWAGTYLLVESNGNYAASGSISSGWLDKTAVTVTNNAIPITPDMEDIEAVVTRIGDLYSIKFKDGFLGSSNSNNGIKIDSSGSGDEYCWNFSISGDGLVKIVLPKVGDRFLCFNSSGFRAYKSLQGTQCTLFKKNGGSAGSNPTVTTDIVTDITKNSAVLHGTFSQMTPAGCKFIYGTSKTNLSLTEAADITGNSFSAKINNLKPATTYYFVAIAVTGTNTYSGAIGEFKTSDEGGGGGGSDKADYGWFELPGQVDKDHDGIDDNNPDYYYSHTFRADSKGIRNFSCCYSKSKIHPVWVAAPLHKCYKGSSGRSGSYKPDPGIYCTQAGSWGGPYNRGHMVGSSERTVSSATNSQVFYYSNIGAQLSSGFNNGGGRWNNLEDFVDTKYCSDTLYTVIGCIFDTWTDRNGNTVQPKTYSGSAIPTAYYKALLRTKSGNTGKSLKNCTADEIMCVAFIVTHDNDHKGVKPSASDMYSISELEELTGLTYFVNVPQAPKSTYKASEWGL